MNRNLSAGSFPRLVSILPALLLTITLPVAHAEIPEPDAVIYGTIALDGEFITADDTDVQVELRASPSGPVLARYRMGDLPGAGDFYSIRARIESGSPVLDPGAVSIGAIVHLTLLDASGVRGTQTVPVTRRGEFIRLDFGDVDSDGDGMPNSFEQTYFGDATAGDPDDDPDGDGRPNRREAEQGTDPLVADGRHPADIDAADDRLTITEVTRYSLAWQLGEAWSIEPTNIPVAYVTRAAALWTGGEFYTFDNDPPTSAPLWWVNTTPPPSPALATTDGGRSGEGPALASARNVSSRRSVALHAGEPTQNDSTTELLLRRELPLEMSANGEPVRVRITVGPNDDTRAFAIEEQPPAGWTVREISHDGRWDATHRKVKWGPFFDQTVRQLTYLAVPPSNVDATATFSGVGSFDGTDYTIPGPDRVSAPGQGQPVRLALRNSGGGTPVLELVAPRGRHVLIETSTDLVSWTAWSSVEVTGSDPLVIPLTAASGADRAFFRARFE